MELIAFAVFLTVVGFPVWLGLFVFGRRVVLWLLGKQPWVVQPVRRSLPDQFSFVTDSELAIRANLRNDDEINRYRKEFLSWAEETKPNVDLDRAYRLFSKWRKEQLPPANTEEEMIRRAREHPSKENYEFDFRDSTNLV